MLCFCFHVGVMSASCCSVLFIFLPSLIMATVLPPKRRRTGYRLPPIVEGSDMSLDSAMYINSEAGGRILVAVPPDAPASENPMTDSGPTPDLDVHDKF